ncbi:hypothetical protein R3I94_014031 [Phoxinus phoxinus]
MDCFEKKMRMKMTK